jgi:hypothetical protein
MPVRIAIWPGLMTSHAIDTLFVCGRIGLLERGLAGSKPRQPFAATHPVSAWRRQGLAPVGSTLQFQFLNLRRLLAALALLASNLQIVVFNNTHAAGRLSASN